MMPAPTLLETKDLCIGYKSSQELGQDINLHIDAGMVITLLGGNGMGKSTLLKTLAGYMKPLSGEIIIDKIQLKRLSAAERAKKIALCQHSMEGASGLRVNEFVALGRQPYTGLFGLLSAKDKEICSEAIEAAGITHKTKSYVSTLSDGERQKAMLARALAQDTPLIFLDEPFSFLDPAGRLEIMQTLRETAKTKHKGILITCHDVALSMRLASVLWLFDTHKHIQCFKPEDPQLPENLNKLYESTAVKFSTQINDFILAQ